MTQFLPPVLDAEGDGPQPQNFYSMLWEFHTAFNLDRATVPALPDEMSANGAALRKLRRKLLREEFNEYLDAEDDNDLVEIADALGDIIYIALGTAVAYGLPLHAIFNEIHRSNMSKLDSNGHPIYREDGKVMKGPNYSPPDIKSIIDRYK